MHFNCFYRCNTRRTAKKRRRYWRLDGIGSSDGGQEEDDALRCLLRRGARGNLAHLKEMRIRTHNFVRHDGFSPKVSQRLLPPIKQAASLPQRHQFHFGIPLVKV